jgi:hypothetical protein
MPMVAGHLGPHEVEALASCLSLSKAPTAQLRISDEFSPPSASGFAH